MKPILFLIPLLFFFSINPANAQKIGEKKTLSLVFQDCYFNDDYGCKIFSFINKDLVNENDEEPNGDLVEFGVIKKIMSFTDNDFDFLTLNKWKLIKSKLEKSQNSATGNLKSQSFKAILTYKNHKGENGYRTNWVITSLEKEAKTKR